MRKLSYWAIGATCVALSATGIASGTVTQAQGLSGAATHAQPFGIEMFDGANLTGTRWVFERDNLNMEGNGGDRVTSIRNSTGGFWVLYEHDTFRGRRYCLRAGESVSNLQLAQWDFNNRISSVRPLGGAIDCRGFPVFHGR